MTLYMVMDYSGMEDDHDFNLIYGIFSTMKKAQKIVNELENHREEGETEEFVIRTFRLNKPTDAYYAMTE